MSLPLHRRIRAVLEEQIRSGELAPGARVPTEAQLQVRYGVSRSTARRALTDLAQEGLIVRYRRNGSFVTDGTGQENLLRFLNPAYEGVEIPGRHVVESKTVIRAGDSELELSGIDPNEAVIEMHRVKLDSEGQVAALEINAVPFSLAPRLLQEEDEQLTMINYFHQTGVPIETSRLYVDPIILDDGDAARFDCDPGVPVFRFRRFTWLEDGSLGEALRMTFRPGFYNFYVEHSVLDGRRAAEAAGELAGGSADPSAAGDAS